MTFKPGQSGNPKGRPKGSRDKITEAFLRNLEKDWRMNGPDALAKAREKDPAAYVKVVASLLPRDVNLNANVNEEFVQFLRAMNAGRLDTEQVASSGDVPEQPTQVRH